MILADVMKSMGVQTVLAVDVGVKEEIDLTNFGDQLSGWWLLANRWYPWSKPIKVSNLNFVFLFIFCCEFFTWM